MVQALLIKQGLYCALVKGAAPKFSKFSGNSQTILRLRILINGKNGIG